MGKLFGALNFVKFIINKKEKNRQRKHAQIQGEQKIRQAKIENMPEITATLAEMDALERKNPAPFGARVIKFGIGLCLIAGMVLVGLILYQAGEGDPSHFEIMVRFITLLESSPNVFFGTISLVSVYAGGRALAAMIKP